MNERHAHAFRPLKMTEDVAGKPLGRSSCTNHFDSRLRRQAVDLPVTVGLQGVLQSVVEAVGAAVPELEAIGMETVAAPEGR